MRPPKVGELRPAAVTAEIIIDTRGLRGDVRSEWDELKQHDVMFLIAGEHARMPSVLSARPPCAIAPHTLRFAPSFMLHTANSIKQTACVLLRNKLDMLPPCAVSPPDAADLSAMSAGGAPPSVCQRYGVAAVRGAEVIEVRDEGGNLMNDFTGRVRPDERKVPEGMWIGSRVFCCLCWWLAWLPVPAGGWQWVVLRAMLVASMVACFLQVVGNGWCCVLVVGMVACACRWLAMGVVACDAGG